MSRNDVVHEIRRARLVTNALTLVVIVGLCVTSLAPSLRPAAPLFGLLCLISMCLGYVRGYTSALLVAHQASDQPACKDPEP